MSTRNNRKKKDTGRVKKKYQEAEMSISFEVEAAAKSMGNHLM